MASQNPNRTPMYPQVIQSDLDNSSQFLSNPGKASTSQSSLYPQIDIEELANDLFPDTQNHNSPSAPPASVEEVLLTVPGAILHLIDKNYSVELACGDFSIIRLLQASNVIIVLARVGDEIQWPLAKDAGTVKLDESHYFFSIRAPIEEGSNAAIDSNNLLNYGLTIASKGQEGLLKELDKVLENYSSFSVQKVSEDAKGSELLDGNVEKKISPLDLKSEKKKEIMEERCAAYWTTLAPNVEDYSGTAAKMIAAGSGQLIKGILWCGDVTVDRLKWGNEVLKERIKPGLNSEISPETMERIRRVKRVTKMTEKVANGVLSGVVKVSGLFTSRVANSRMGKKLFGLLPGEIVLATMDGFSKVCDAAEVAGKNVMSTSSTVTTGLVSHKYGEEAAKATSEGLGAAGHAAGTLWSVLKIRQALNPKNAFKSSSLAKSAAKAAAATATATAKAKNNT
ncbi:hypothetical protein NMG60_11007840 [Bertholletia excelsa]